MAEYIERESAIQAASIWNGDESTEAWIKSALKKLPAADVRPVVHGKWENTGGHEWRCSQCGYGIMPWNAGQNFCPNCGADMREES